MNPLGQRRHAAIAVLLTALVGASSCLTSSVSAEKEAPAISPLATQGPKPAPITPPTAEELHRSIERGVDFLLRVQLSNGAWGSAQRTKAENIYAPVPGSHHAFRTAVTSLVLMALMESHDQFVGQRQQDIETAIDRGQQWLLQYAKKLRRADAEALYNVWGHAYASQAIVRLHRRAAGNAPLQARLMDLLAYQVDMLRRFQSINGGWGYYDMAAHTQRPSSSSISFTTATVLIALQEAASLGVGFPPDRTQQAIDSILRQRFPDFSYAYGEYLRMMPRYGINRPAGSLGRSQVCNLALRLYGDKRVSDAVIKTWLNRLYARNGWLSMARKRPIPHESYFSIAGYFYYYGHFYAAMCIDQLPEADRPYFQDHLAHLLIPLQEKDGSWWDFPLYNYHQQYGTAMAVVALIHCQHATTGSAVK